MLQKSQEMVSSTPPRHRLAGMTGLMNVEQVFACKKCKKCFRKDAAEFDERYDYPASRRRKLCGTNLAPLVTSSAHTVITTSFLKP